MRAVPPESLEPYIDVSPVREGAAAHVARGGELLARGRPKDALESFERAVALDNASAAAHMRCGPLAHRRDVDERL